MNALKVLLARFSQPSSWAGLGALLALCGFNVPAGTLALLVQAGAGVCGLVAILVNEKSAASTTRAIALFVPAIGVLAFLGACGGNPLAGVNKQFVDPALKTLAQVANTAAKDLTNTENVAKAATPPDTYGFDCAAATLVVLGQIQQVTAANNLGDAGVFTAAEMASLFQPGSAQYNQATNTIATGCIAKANAVLGPANVIAAGGVMAVLPRIIPLAAAG